MTSSWAGTFEKAFEGLPIIVAVVGGIILLQKLKDVGMIDIFGGIVKVLGGGAGGGAPVTIQGNGGPSQTATTTPTPSTIDLTPKSVISAVTTVGKQGLPGITIPWLPGPVGMAQWGIGMAIAGGYYLITGGTDAFYAVDSSGRVISKDEYYRIVGTVSSSPIVQTAGSYKTPITYKGKTYQATKSVMTVSGGARVAGH